MKKTTITTIFSFFFWFFWMIILGFCLFLLGNFLFFVKGFLIWVISCFFFFFFFCDDLPNMFVNDLPQIKKWYVLIIEIDDRGIFSHNRPCWSTFAYPKISVMAIQVVLIITKEVNFCQFLGWKSGYLELEMCHLLSPS